MFVGPGLGNPNPILRGSGPNWHYQPNTSTRSGQSNTLFFSLVCDTATAETTEPELQNRERWTVNWSVRLRFRQQSHSHTGSHAILATITQAHTRFRQHSFLLHRF